jgi:hypothetical protein
LDGGATQGHIASTVVAADPQERDGIAIIREGMIPASVIRSGADHQRRGLGRVRVYLFIAAVAGGVTWLVTPSGAAPVHSRRRGGRSARPRCAHHADSAHGRRWHADRLR